MTRRLARTCISVVAAFALFALAGSPALAKTKTKTATFNQCADVNAPIPDAGLASGLINLPVPKNGKKIQDGVVTAVQAGIRIPHPRSSQLDISLVSPGGKAVALASDESGPTGSPAGYGNGAASCTGSLVTFGDAFPTSIEDNGALEGTPIVGQFKPRQPFAPFNGGPARGAWVLLAADCCLGGESGTISAFSLNVTYTYKLQVKKKKHKK